MTGTGSEGENKTVGRRQSQGQEGTGARVLGKPATRTPRCLELAQSLHCDAVLTCVT